MQRMFHVVLREGREKQTVVDVLAESTVEAADIAIGSLASDETIIVDVIEDIGHTYTVRNEDGNLMQGKTTLTLYEFAELCQKASLEIVKWID